MQEESDNRSKKIEGKDSVATIKTKETDETDWLKNTSHL